MIRILAILAFLCSCGGPPRLVNPGAAIPITALSDYDMSLEAKRFPVEAGHYLRGYFNHCPRAIFLLEGTDESVLAHECAHLGDTMGGNYAEAIRLVTPPNPSPEMAVKLRTLWEIERAPGGYWREICRRWGRGAVGHPDILARIEQ